VEPPVGLERLLEEQRAYYREIAPEYEKYALQEFQGAALLAALTAFKAQGDVLELACGTGVWTEQLVKTARYLTAVDASAEMIAIASRRVAGHSVDFIQADLFTWRPPRRFDAVVFGFWLSHVPRSRFDAFWALVADCLAPDGRVFFADDAHREPEELVYGENSEIVRRRLADGGAHHVVKVAHTPAELERRLHGLGWRIKVVQADGPFYWGSGSGS